MGPEYSPGLAACAMTFMPVVFVYVVAMHMSVDRCVRHVNSQPNSAWVATKHAYTLTTHTVGNPRPCITHPMSTHARRGSARLTIARNHQDGARNGGKATSKHDSSGGYLSVGTHKWASKRLGYALALIKSKKVEGKDGSDTQQGGGHASVETGQTLALDGASKHIRLQVGLCDGWWTGYVCLTKSWVGQER